MRGCHDLILIWRGVASSSFVNNVVVVLDRGGLRDVLNPVGGRTLYALSYLYDKLAPY